MYPVPPLARLLRTTALAVSCFVGAHAAHAQAQYAGTYIGTFNTRQSAGGLSIELPSTGYIAVVSATGTINVNSGAMTGTVSATGAVKLTGGFELSAMGITDATIANNKLSSDYGAKVANGVSEWKFNPSTSFTPSSGGSSGGGSSGGGSSGGGTATGGAQFRFDGNVTDPVGSNNGTLNGGVTYETGISGQAVRFNGSSGYITFGTANIVSDAGPFSVAFWFKPTASQIMVPIRLKTASTEFATRIGLNASDSTSLGASIYFGFRGSAGIISKDPRYYIQSTLNQWVHLTIVYKGGNKSSASSFDLFVNGEKLTLTTIGTVGGSANANEIGRDGGGGSYVAGLIDEVRITNTAMTVGDSAAAYAAAPTVTGVTTAPANLAGYRNKVGQTFDFVVTGATSGGSIWGTDVYTDDSAVGVAAVHSGVVAPGETKTLSITILPGQSSYTASTRNGVTSSSWGAWTGSYSFAGAAGSTGTASVAPTVVYAPPSTTNVAVGGRLTLSVTVGGVGPFTYEWYLNGTLITGAVGATYNIASASSANAGTYSVRATNAAGTTTINAGTVTVANAGAPSITLQPLSKTVAPGAKFSLLVTAYGTGTLSYQWRKDGFAIPGATQAAFEVTTATSAASGNYTCVITNSAGTITTSPATVTVTTDASRPANISCRTYISGQIVTPGFFVQGTGTKRVLIRAVGPGLGVFGLSGFMPDPKFELYRGNTKIGENDNWDAGLASTFASASAFGLPANSKDAAIVATLSANDGYTVQVSGVNGSSGIVLIEVYDLDNPATATNKLVNVSVRGQSGTGDRVLILGFVVNGTGKRSLLVRGIGPKLAAFGVPGTLADPKLELFDANSRSILDNDNWGSAPFVAEQMLATDYVSAFALDNNSKDAATLALLDPGSYTVQVKGADGGTGEALVEVYDVP